jgi:hypothetical protein
MRKMRHALSGAIYEVHEDGSIRVEARDGRVGFFSLLGQHLSGELTSVDPQMCGWIGGVQLASRHAESAQKIKEDEAKAALAAQEA